MALHSRGHDGPVALLLTRQDVPVLAGSTDHDAVARGAYVLADSDGDPDVVLIGTGSEVAVALDAAATLTAAGSFRARGLDAVH